MATWTPGTVVPVSVNDGEAATSGSWSPDDIPAATVNAGQDATAGTYSPDEAVNINGRLIEQTGVYFADINGVRILLNFGPDEGDGATSSAWTADDNTSASVSAGQSPAAVTW